MPAFPTRAVLPAGMRSGIFQHPGPVDRSTQECRLINMSIEFPTTAQFAYTRSGGTAFTLDVNGAVDYFRARLLDAAANTGAAQMAV
jgi:hypothetical protein